MLQVRLETGQELYVRPEFLKEGTSSSESEQEEALVSSGIDLDFGSDEEEEECEPEEARELEGSEPARANAVLDPDWKERNIARDQRLMEGWSPPRKGGMRQHVAQLCDSIFAYFWAFVPFIELDQSLEDMEEARRRR